MRSLLFILILPSLLLAEEFPSFKWETVRNKDGVRLHRSVDAEDALPAFRVEGILDSPMERTLTALLDEGRPEWMEGLLESRVLTTDATGAELHYERLKTLPLLAKRDLVSAARTSVDPKSRTIHIRSLPAEDPGAPPLKGHVRGELWLEFQVQPMTIEGQSYVRMTARFDPKGKVPNWLSEFWTKRWVVKNFRDLRDHVKKGDLKASKEAAELMKGLQGNSKSAVRSPK